MDKKLEFLKNACLALVDKILTDRLLAKVANVSTMERYFLVDEGVLRDLDEDFVRDAQRYSFSASQKPEHGAVCVVGSGYALRVVFQTTQAHGATERSFHQKLSRNCFRLASRRHADILRLAYTRCCTALLLRSLG